MNADFAKEVNAARRVAIVGPECTGKTVLAQTLAEHYNTEWVREYARGYLDKLVLPYDQHDLLNIAQGQMRIEDEFASDAKKVLLCDTNLLVIKVWSEFKYQQCDAWILEEMTKRNYALHLLTYVDVPWQDDPQREHPHKREELYNIYKTELQNMKVPFVEIKGNAEERKKSSVEAINAMLANG